MDSNLEPWMLKLLKNIEVEDKEELEETYGVEFDPDSLRLSCLIITSFCNDFKEASNDDKERILKEHIVKILDAACQRVICNLHKVVEEDGSDFEYLLHRACVEYAAIRKEKELLCSELWIPRVRKEYEDLMDTWHKFEKKWKPLLLSQSQTRVEELGMLKQVYGELLSYLEDEKAIKEVEVSMFQKLNDLRAKIEDSFNKELKQILTVRESDILEAARRILSIPVLWPSKYFKPNYEELETRLANRVFGQEHAIRAITNALSGPQYGKGPIRSFLFIRSSEAGGEELIRALAEQLFYDEDRVIEFDLQAKNAEDDSVMHPDVRQVKFGFDLAGCTCILQTQDDSIMHPDVRQINFELLSKDCGLKEKLIDAVNKMPSSIILLRNIDKADASVIGFLLEILRNGKIADDKGKMVDFTKMLIIMTSNVLANLDSRRLLIGKNGKCNCAFASGKIFLHDREKSFLRKMEDHDCLYLSVLEDAKQHFKPELLEIIDNMIVFKLLIHSDFRALLRLKIRKLANSIGGGRIIVYPSEAALHIIAPMIEPFYDRIKPNLEEKVVPKLLEICNQHSVARSIVYMDTLVGTTDLSYRVEMDGCFTGDQEFEQLLAYVWEFGNTCKREMLWLRNINGLRKALQFINQTKINGDLVSLEPLAHRIRRLLTSENSVNSIPGNLRKNSFSSFTNLSRCDQLKKRAERIENHIITSYRRLVNKGLLYRHYVYTVIARTILGCPRVVAKNSHPMTALLLGLTNEGKANLRRDLAKLLHDEHNGVADTLVQINLSECSNYDEFFKLIYKGHNQHGLGCPRRVGMRLGSVLLIDQVEKAPMSVFSGLISLLDYRMLSHHNRACTIDLRDTVIIMVSDMGNSDFIAQMLRISSSRHPYLSAINLFRSRRGPLPQSDSCFWENLKKPKSRSRFRFELLNRVDEIVFFNPSVGGDHQLTKFARLSMRDGHHLKIGTPPGALSKCFMVLFDENYVGNSFGYLPFSQAMDLSSGFLEEDWLINTIADLMARQASLNINVKYKNQVVIG
ncbi:hypothetical protein PTKIN_Ptkin18bG0129200 [Pterospermum kingtungense]